MWNLVEPAAPRGRVERFEEPVPRGHLGLGQRVHQRALAGVGVADQGDERDAGAVTLLALLVTMRADPLEVLLEPLDLIADQPAVGFELSFAGTARADRALHAFEVRPLTGQPRQQVLMLGERDLDRAFAGSRALRKDIQNQRGAVDDLAVESFLEIALLGGRELVVADHDGGAEVVAHGGDLLNLALADPGARVGVRAPLDHARERHRASPSRQAARARRSRLQRSSG